MKPTPLTRLLLPLILIMAVASGCAKQPVSSGEATSIGPFNSFSGRLIVIEPARRWQVIIQWHAESADRGDVRLSHAATGTVVEFRWSGSLMQIRDGNASYWRDIDTTELAKHGIVIPPRQLASILLGRMPAHFVRKRDNQWESRRSGSLVRLQWFPESHKLYMSDIANGRKATLLIQP